MIFDCPKTPEAQKEMNVYMEKNKPTEQSLSIGDPIKLKQEMKDYKLAMKWVKVI